MSTQPNPPANEVVPYVTVPRVVYDALRDGVITHEMFDIFQYGYYRANRAESYRVESYSAASICRFLLLDATEANLKRYRRAANDMWDRHLIQRDYHKGTERPYSMWLPRPERFTFLSTSPKENDALWGVVPPCGTKEPMSVLPVRPYVLPPSGSSDGGSETYRDEGTDTGQPLSVQNVDVLSINNQGTPCSNAAQAYIPSANASGNIQDDVAATPPVVGPAQPAGPASAAGLANRRVGEKATPKATELQDEAERLGAYVFEQSHCQPPSKQSVRALLKQFSLVELRDAFDECIENRKGRELISSVRLFFTSGASAIVRLQRDRTASLVNLIKQTYTPATRIEDLEKAAKAAGLYRESYDSVDRAVTAWLDEFSDDDQNAIMDQLYS